METVSFSTLFYLTLVFSLLTLKFFGHISSWQRGRNPWHSDRGAWENSYYRTYMHCMRMYVYAKRCVNRTQKKGDALGVGKQRSPPSRKKKPRPSLLPPRVASLKRSFASSSSFPGKKNSRPCSIVNACSPLQCVQKKTGKIVFFKKKTKKKNPDRNKKKLLLSRRFLPSAIFFTFGICRKLHRSVHIIYFFGSLRGGGEGTNWPVKEKKAAGLPKTVLGKWCGGVSHLTSYFLLATNPRQTQIQIQRRGINFLRRFASPKKKEELPSNCATHPDLPLFSAFDKKNMWHDAESMIWHFRLCSQHLPSFSQKREEGGKRTGK